jgi:hypothetical protein
MTLDETFDGLTDEEKEQAKKATSMEEVEKIAEGGGMELSLDDLDAAAGGRASWDTCKVYAQRCHQWDRANQLRCPAYRDRGWD